MAIHAVHHSFFGFKQFFVLLVMPDESATSINFRYVAPTMALTTQFSIAVNFHSDQLGIVNMIAPRPVTFLALNTIFGPGANQTRQVVLIPLGTVAGCMARTAVVGFFLARMVSHPIVAHIQVRVVKVILGGAILVAGDDEPILVDETRPRLQGARLTAWELDRIGVSYDLIADNAAGHFMRTGQVNLVLVGADRIAANGDVANKIGTYQTAVLARENKISFYVAAPISTIDLEISSGNLIPVEERDPREISHLGRQRIGPAGVRILNPAFDITPAKYITAIITEKGIVRAPYKREIKNLFKRG